MTPNSLAIEVKWSYYGHGLGTCDDEAPAGTQLEKDL
jgi:hypothetical protein